MAAFENQTYNLLNNKSLSAFTVDLQWMSAFTVGIYSIYTINIPISLIITEVEELLLASAGTLLGCQPRPGSSILASCSGLTLREFVSVADGLFTFCVSDQSLLQLCWKRQHANT